MIKITIEAERLNHMNEFKKEKLNVVLDGPVKKVIYDPQYGGYGLEIIYVDQEEDSES